MSKLPKGALSNISFSELKKLEIDNGNEIRTVINQVLDSFGGVINQENINEVIKVGEILGEDFFDYFFEYFKKKSEMDTLFIMILPSSIDTGRISDSKLNTYFEKVCKLAEHNPNFAKYTLPTLINTGKIDESKLNSYFEKAFELAREENLFFSEDIVPALINTGKIDKAKLNIYFEKACILAKSSVEFVEYIIPSLIKSGKIGESKLNSYLEYAFKEAEINYEFAKYVVPTLINSLNIDESKLNTYFEHSINLADINNNFVRFIIPPLVKTGKISEKNIVKLNTYFEDAFKEADLNSDFSEYIIPSLINTGKIDEIKLNTCFVDSINLAKTNVQFFKCIIPSLINTGKVNKYRLNMYFKYIIEKAEKNIYFDKNIFPYIVSSLVNSGELNEENIAKLNFYFESVFEKSKTDEYVAKYVIPELIKTGKIDESKLNTYFRDSINLAKTNSNFAQYIIPELVKTGKISEKNIVKLNNFFEYAVKKLETNTDFSRFVVPVLIETGKIKIISGNDKVVEKSLIEEKYKENYKIFNEILNKDIKSIELYFYAKENFFNLEKLKSMLTFLSYKNLDYSLFLNNYQDPLKILESKSLEFGYFKKSLLYGLFNEKKLSIRDTVKEKIKNLGIKLFQDNKYTFPITKSNFTDFLEDDESLFEFESDKGFNGDPKVWTKQWFNKDKNRYNYLNSSNLKVFEKFGTIIGEGILKGAGDSIKMKDYYSSTLEQITLEKNRSSILQISEVLNISLKNGKYDFFDELVDNEFDIGPKFKNFIKQHYISDKGRTVLTLMIAREIRDSFQIWENENKEEQVENIDIKTMLKRVYEKLISYNEVINKYEELPIQTSIGMEYEVTQSISDGYKNEIGSDYKKDITTISEYSGIARGSDAVHEIATKPTSNPYLLILEMQLLQDLDFLDLNFKKEDYSRGARGLHITVGGEYGIKLDNNSNFIQNTLIASNLGGINAGNEIDKVNVISSIRAKGSDCEAIFSDNKTECTEYRALSIDKSETFERVILSIFNLNMAKQLYNKYLDGYDAKILLDKYGNLKSFSDFIKGYNKGLIITDLEIKIIYEYFEFTNSIETIIENHNLNFEKNEVVSGNIEKSLEKVLFLIESTGPIINILNICGIDMIYIKDLENIENKEQFEIQLKKDGKKINKLSNRQKEILFLNYQKRLKPQLNELKINYPEVYNNIKNYLNGNTIDTIRKITNRKRFEEVINLEGKTYEEYINSLKIDRYKFFNKEITPDMINIFTRINNLFIKKDSPNALSMLDTTREHNGELIQNKDMSETTIFQKIDRGLKERNGYNIIQGASENMLTQAIQKRTLEFNEKIGVILT